jgi:hypothetical protein
MFEDFLETPPVLRGNRNSDTETVEPQFFINFINVLEGFKTKCKNLHWSAPKKNIHEYLDAFLKVISDYQDGLAESYQGILGKMQPNAIKGVPSDTLNALDFIREVNNKTLEFYNSIPAEPVYAGIKSECETFIYNISKYNYLFSLCDIRVY